MAPSQILALLPLGGHIADKGNITGASRLYRAGMHSEMFKHIENGLEPHMVNRGVTRLIQWQMLVLGPALEVESVYIFTTSCLTLMYQEDIMGASASFTLEQ